MLGRFLLLLISLSVASARDKSRGCYDWSELGECEKNPTYMLSECEDSCARRKAMLEEQNARLNGITSFFDLEANDLDGHLYSFSQLKGKVTVVANVASECAFANSAYKGEPGSRDEIRDYVKSKGVEFKMMEKIDVNGPNTSPVYLFLKKQTDMPVIAWNFGTYFVVGPDGTVTEYTGVAPFHLKPYIDELLGKEEL
ncbi:Glutathione peroxidase [Fragilaria crotonensis]|nr:Glutathione peroxidase [Fragilaria crotonensis]